MRLLARRAAICRLFARPTRLRFRTPSIQSLFNGRISHTPDALLPQFEQRSLLRAVIRIAAEELDAVPFAGDGVVGPNISLLDAVGEIDVFEKKFPPVRSASHLETVAFDVMFNVVEDYRVSEGFALGGFTERCQAVQFVYIVASVDEDRGALRM